jgi:hypothetical protein
VNHISGEYDRVLGLGEFSCQPVEILELGFRGRRGLAALHRVKQPLGVGVVDLAHHQIEWERQEGRAGHLGPRRFERVGDQGGDFLDGRDLAGVLAHRRHHADAVNALVRPVEDPLAAYDLRRYRKHR